MDEFADTPSLAEPPMKGDSIVDNARYYEIPAGTRISECTGPTCEKTIYWITYQKEEKDGSMKEVRQPVDVDVPDGLAPTKTEPGRGVSHYVTCPDAGHFSKRKKP